jgi:hypothetical protein
MNDFTIGKYKELWSALLELDYRPLSVSDYIGFGRNETEKIAISRHDIDRKPLNALRVAEAEKELGIRSTYYFRYPHTFKKAIINEILDMGHEIGYHYEVLSKCNGDVKEAIKLFEYELNEFRSVTDIKTICMHGSPLSKYDNKELWKHYDFKSYGIIGEAYISINNINYFSDSGRTWGPKNKIRDLKAESNYMANTTDGLITLINHEIFDQIYILTHPERWASNNSEWIFNFFKDQAFNIGKKFLAGA